MTECSIVVEYQPNPDDEKIILDGLIAFTVSQVGEFRRENFSVFLRDDTGQVVGGVSAIIRSNWLFVSLLWVREDVRGCGYGLALMKTIEAEGLKQGCEHAYLDTFDFQARGFYEKLGYEVFGQLDDFPSEHTRFFMKKFKLRDT